MLVQFHLDACLKTGEEQTSPQYLRKGAEANYRPVSLTSVVSKVLEKVLQKRLMTFLEAADYFFKNQHGFRSGMPCLTQLHEYLNDVENMVDEGDCIGVIYLDCRKAFDTAP